MTPPAPEPADASICNPADSYIQPVEEKFLMFEFLVGKMKSHDIKTI
jgi:hypothetical protein